jgi:ribosomal-protein-alanine N-acetyltransferase
MFHHAGMDTASPFPIAVSLSPPSRSDRADFLKAVWESRALHGEWVSPPDTRGAYAAYLSRLKSGRNEAFLVRDEEDGGLVGVVNVSEIVRGDFQSAYLGYYAFAAKAGRGLMTAGLLALVRHAFRELGLHRLEANVQPRNTRSIKLAERCGFRHEGLSRHYLRINGIWQDHERYAITVEDIN